MNVNVKESYTYEYTKSFKAEKDVTREMETNFGMVCIKLVKIPNFNIDLSGNSKQMKKIEHLQENL